MPVRPVAGQDIRPADGSTEGNVRITVVRHVSV
jgi:hypothetical protein